MFGYHGFGRTLLVINDLDLAKQMFIKDFDYFLDRRTLDLGHEYFNKMLVFLEGEAWKEMRTITSPVFTSGKLKNMTRMINGVGKDFAYHVEKLALREEEANARDLSTRGACVSFNEILRNI